MPGKTKMEFKVLCLLTLSIIFFPLNLYSKQKSCIECHKEQQPGLVADWEKSKMAINGLDCSDCHGNKHKGPDDGFNALMPAIATCEKCHPEQAVQFKKGKHALAETALKIAPMGHKVKKDASIVFETSCAVCHLEAGKDGGQCDACHSGHMFSAREAKKPEACLPCHIGNHPSYEAYYHSKHGALYKMRGPDSGAPTCATCHMNNGDHKLMTSWGFFGIRPGEKDKEHAKYQKPVIRALKTLGPILAPQSTRASSKEWNKLRADMISVCSDCHSASFAKRHLERGDAVVKQANKIAAKTILAAEELRFKKVLSREDFFWFLRHKIHAQRMSMYIHAFHQNPEDVLLNFIHLKGVSRDIKKKVTIQRKSVAKRISAADLHR